jgi:hypothetical protein
MKRLICLGHICCAAFLFTAWVGCSDDTFDSVSDFEAVVTNRQPKNTYDYAKNRTWTMPDVILDLSAESVDDVAVTPAVELAILTAVAENMAALGYEFVPWPTGENDAVEDEGKGEGEGEGDGKGESASGAAVIPGLDADVLLLPTVIMNPTYREASYCHPYYYDLAASCVVFPNAAYQRTQAILLSLVDTGTIAPNDDGVLVMRPVWSAALHGLLTDTTHVDKIRDGVSQAFAQSAYLSVDAQ